MRLFFEDGELKILVDEENTYERKKFLYNTYGYFKRWDKNQKNVLIVELAKHWIYHVQEAIFLQERGRQFEIDPDVEQWYKKEEEENRKAYELEQEKKRREEILKRAESVKQNGCGLCQHLRMEGYRHLCTYAAKYCLYKPYELEYEFECRKEAKALNKPVEWFATPYPCNGCEKLKQALEVHEIINLEEQGNGKHDIV